MATPRRKYYLADTTHSNVDLRVYHKVIIEAIENVVPGKNPKVFKEYYSTDETTQGESVKVGRALAKIPELKQYGKTVTIFRLFDGKVYSSESATQPINKKSKSKPKGGRMK